MPTQDQLADFIRRRISVGRVRPDADCFYVGRYRMPFQAAPLPAFEQVAAELVRDTEFRALQLGTFLNTPSGEFLEEQSPWLSRERSCRSSLSSSTRSSWRRNFSRVRLGGL